MRTGSAASVLWTSSPMPVLLGALLLACGSPDESPTRSTPVLEPTRAALLRETVDVVIMPGYRAVEASAATLHTRTTELCDGSPDAAGVEAAREAWRALFLSWERTEPFQFGPTIDLALGGELAFHPARVELIEANIAASTPLDDASLAELGAASHGVFALEYLLFSPPAGGEVAAALAASPRRCEYLVLTAGHARRVSARLVTEWTPYGEALATAGAPGNATFPSQLRAISALFTQIVATATAIKRNRLGVPLGDRTAGMPQPNAVRSRYAGASNDGMLAGVDGIVASWTAGVEGRGLGGYLALRDPALATQVLAQMTTVRRVVDAIPDPLEEYLITSDRMLALEAKYETGNLERLLGTTVATTLSISVLFTDADGD